MLSVRKQEILQNGMIGAVCIIFSVINWFTDRDLLAVIVLGLIILMSLASFVYQRKNKQEPWDELTVHNYAVARRITLFYVEATLLIWTIMCVLLHVQVTIEASHILFYYGSIKLVQTGSFLYNDSHIVE